MAIKLKLEDLPPEVRWEIGPGFQADGYLTRSHVILIGAGGVGARLAPLLVKHLINGDALTIVDHDTVEPKNITRQHFTAGDVGKSKALIVAQRAESAAPSAGIIITGVQLKAESSGLIAELEPGGRVVPSPGGRINGRPVLYKTIVVSAIDSRAGRKALLGLGTPIEYFAWVDCGNDMVGGQALVAGIEGWVRVISAGSAPGARGHLYPVKFDGWGELAPSFLDVKEEEEPKVEDCAVRVDTQSVLANTWAATAALTLTVPFITGSPLHSLGVKFSSRFGITTTVGVRSVKGPQYARPGTKYATLTPTGKLLA